MNLRKYKSLVFDCDGVVLNSNPIKTISFRKALASYGEEAVNKFVHYHKANGGISRYKKIRYFLSDIAPKYSSVMDGEKEVELLLKYNDICKKALLQSEIAPGLEELRNLSLNANWLIVSGGDQSELREVFNYKKINRFFDGGIFGSPDDKEKILRREIANGCIKQPSLFIGDSRLDHEVSSENGLDFVFVSEWTDFEDYELYCQKNSILVINSIFELLDFLKA